MSDKTGRPIPRARTILGLDIDHGVEVRVTEDCGRRIEASIEEATRKHITLVVREDEA